MVTNGAQNRLHVLLKGERLPELRKQLTAELGRAPEAAEVAKALGVEPAQVAELAAARQRGYRDGGFQLWDISDKSKPRQLTHQRTFGFGTHRLAHTAGHPYITPAQKGSLANTPLL